MTKYNPINDRIINDILTLRSKIDSEKLISNDNQDLKGSFNKKIANITAMTFRKYIINILNYYGLRFKVSHVNSYVVDCPIEWDLIILKDTAEDIDNTNVFNVEDVVVLLEFKTSGLTVDRFNNIEGEFQSRVNYINYFKEKYKVFIPFGYITLAESISYYERTRDYFNKINEVSDKNINTAFAFLDWIMLYKNDEKHYIRECNDFEKFLYDLIKLRRNL